MTALRCVFGCVLALASLALVGLMVWGGRGWWALLFMWPFCIGCSLVRSPAPPIRSVSEACEILRKAQRPDSKVGLS